MGKGDGAERLGARSGRWDGASTPCVLAGEEHRKRPLNPGQVAIVAGEAVLGCVEVEALLAVAAEGGAPGPED